MRRKDLYWAQKRTISYWRKAKGKQGNQSRKKVERGGDLEYWRRNATTSKPSTTARSENREARKKKEEKREIKD